MKVFKILQSLKDDVQCLILWDEYLKRYRQVNLIYPHICKCMFKSIEEAINDLSKRPEVTSYTIEILNNYDTIIRKL